MKQTVLIYLVGDETEWDLPYYAEGRGDFQKRKSDLPRSASFQKKKWSPAVESTISKMTSVRSATGTRESDHFSCPREKDGESWHLGAPFHRCLMIG